MDATPAPAKAPQRLGFALAVVGVLVGAGVRLLLPAALGERVAFLLFIPAVVAASAVGGLWPGLLALVCGVVGGLALNSGPTGQDALAGAVYGLAGAVIVIGGEWFQRQRRRTVAANGELIQREAQLQSILDTVPDAMIVIDDKGLVRSFSHAAEQLFGWTSAEIVGRNVSALMPSPHREDHDAYLERYYRTGERRIIGRGRVVTGERRDGTTFPMELAVGEVKGATGRFFTGFVRDLTERQQAEMRMQELQAELVHVSRLTAMGEMASALAHELNQPLAAITNYVRGSLRLLSGKEPSLERLREASSKAVEQAIRAGEIIRRLREFAARGETERRVESLARIVEEAAALGLVGAKEHGVRATLRNEPSTAPVLADKVQVQQVVLNLIRNAIDAMAEASRRELTVSVGPGPGGYSQVTVADTGPGIDPAVAGELFQPFVTTKREGMGVGLSISRTIVEAHGGRLWVETTPGGGATFRFTLPAVDEKELDE